MTTWLDRVSGQGRIRIEPFDWLGLEYLCFHARAIDAEEIYGNLPTENPIEWASMVHAAIARNGQAFIGYFNGRPSAFMGVYEQWPGNWSIASFGTDDYRRTLVAFRPKFEELIAYGLERGMHRLEAKSIITHREAHGFLRLFKFEQEAILKQFAVMVKTTFYFGGYGRMGKRYRDMTPGQKAKTLARNKAWDKAHREQVNAGQRRRRGDNKEKWNEYNRQWRLDHPGKQAEYTRRCYGKNKDKAKERAKAWLEKNPTYFRDWTRERAREKKRANWLVRSAKKSGKLTQQPCEVCGNSSKVHAHHDDYAKPLEVRWLCTVHHGEQHRKPLA